MSVPRIFWNHVPNDISDRILWLKGMVRFGRSEVDSTAVDDGMLLDLAEDERGRFTR